jgi:L-iditol 2-dehydrogenase
VRVFKYLGPQRAEIAEIPVPTIGTGEVLVRTAACGLCATDVKTYMRGHPLIPAGTVLGHEMSGVIVESAAEGWLSGERVVVAPYVSCGACLHCQRGQDSLCSHLWDASVEPGGFSEYIRVPGRIVRVGLHRLPDSVDFLVASLAEPLACCYHGLEAINARSGESLLIIGDGPMGILQAMIGRSLGMAPVVLVGLTPERLALAQRHAHTIVNLQEVELHETVMALSDGQGFDKIMVAVGQAEVAEQALALARRGGAVNLFAGLPSTARLTLDPRRIHYDEIALLGTFGFGSRHFRRAVESLASGALDVTGFFTRVASLDELEGALVDAASYRGIKSALVFP